MTHPSTATPQHGAAIVTAGGTRVPLGRQAQPEEIAWWIAQATRPAALYLTGAVLRVDGGISGC